MYVIEHFHMNARNVRIAPFGDMDMLHISGILSIAS